MRVGRTVTCAPLTFGDGTKRMKGTVIWVHPKKRFARVAFQIRGKYKTIELVECFSPVEIYVTRK